MAGVPGVPRRNGSNPGAAGPRRGALELLLRLRRVGDGGQRHRGSRRRIVPNRRRGRSATACSISTRWASCPPSPVCRPFFYVENPTNVAGGIGIGRCAARRRDDSTARGGTCSSRTSSPPTARGNPSAAQSSRVHRQAFLFVVGAGRAPGNAQVEKVDRIRREWESFFLRATNNRMTADTRLR